MKHFSIFKIAMGTIIFLISIVTTANATDNLSLIKGSVEINFSFKEVMERKSKKIYTSTPWTKKTIFEGVKLSDLIGFKGDNKGKIRLYALDGYWVEIPISDINNYEPILAYKANGKLLHRRDFGPFFLVYPYDEMENELNTPVYHSRSIWQVNRIEVKGENL